MNAPTHTQLTFSQSAACFLKRYFCYAAFVFVITLPMVAQGVTCTSNVAPTGNWNTAGSWTCTSGGNHVPLAGEDVVIAAGDTINLNVNTANLASLTVNGTLGLGDNTARTVTVSGTVTVASGGTITVNNFNDTHTFNLAGNLVNDGVFDMNTGADDICNVTFNGAANQTVSGTGATTDFNFITVNNSGAANDNIVDVTSSNFVATDLTLTDGVFRLSTGGNLAITGNLTIGAGTGLIINHASAVVTNPSDDYLVSGGDFQLLAGTVSNGNGNDHFITSSGTATFSGGTLTVNGDFLMTGGTTTINGATINVDSQGSSSSQEDSFEAQGNAVLTFSSGTVVIVDPHADSDTWNAIQLVSGAGAKNLAGSTFQLGNGVSTTSGTSDGFDVNCGSGLTIGNLVVNNPSGTNRHTRLVTNNCTIGGDLTITAGTFQANGLAINIAGDWTNNGTFTPGTQTTTFNASSGEQTIAGSSATGFNALTVANTGTGTTNMTTSGSASGVLTLTSDLTVTDPAMLTQSGTSSGAGDVVGRVRRADFGATTRSFGNVNVQLTRTGGTATQVDVFLVKGTAPSGFAQAVLRTYTLSLVSGTLTGATVRLRYIQASELNGNTEATLDLWRNDSGTWTNLGGVPNTGSDYVELTGVTAFSSWAIASPPSAPTAVKLARFNAFGYADGVGIAWQSGDEVNNLGYHIYRDVNGRRVRVTPSLVAGSALRVGPGMRMAAGFSYNWFDPSGNANTGYYLEAVDLNGTREVFGPVYPLAGKGISPRGQRARLVNELNLAGRADGGQRFVSGWAASSVKSDRNELSKLSSASLSGQHKIAAGPAVKIPIQRNGWYRLNHAQLAAAGLDVSRDARFLQMFVDGEEIPIRLSGNGINFTPSDTIEFYGLGLDTPSTDKRVYWLVSGSQQGRRISAKRPKGRNDIEWSQSGVPSSYLFTSEVKERISYFPNLLNGDAENIFGPLVTDVPETQTIQVNNPDRQTGSAQLSVALQGASTHEHAVQVQLNNVVLDTVVFNGMQNVVRHLNVDRSLLLEGANTLKFTAVNGELDIVFVDWARLTYLRQYKAKNNELQFSLNPGRAVRVSGFTTPDIRVMDITNPDAVAEVPAQIMPLANGYGAVVQAQGAGQRTLIAVGNDAINPVDSVSANQPSSWHNGAHAADMVIITHRDFRNAVEPLAALRRNQGLAVVVVDVEDVFDEFGFGAHSPTAVKAFLSWAASSWARAPRYLLLAGDSSWDPRNYTQEGDNDFVPTKMVDTRLMETASDDWLVDFNGDDVADMAVGRLPGRTAAEIGLMVAKIQRYELDIDQGAAPRGALLVADAGFEAESSQTGSLLPPGMAVQTINRSQVGNDDVARSQIMTALNNGPLVVNYYGHGSVNVWTGAGLLDNDLAATLTNSNRLSLFVMMTCLNGYAHDAYTETLGEAVLKAPNGGAVAVWASSGFTEPQPQFVMDTEFYRQLFGTEPVRLGEAARNAKAVVSDPDVRRTWILLGDPAMRIR